MTRVFETISDGAAICDREWRFTFVNQRGAEIAGRSPEEFVGQSLWDIYPQAVGSTVYNELERVLTEQIVVRFQAFHAALNCWLEVRAYPIPSGVIILHQDISAWKQTEVELQQNCDALSSQIEEQLTQLQQTRHELERQINQRQQAEDALQSTNEAFAHLLESITDGFCAVDTEWQFTYVNHQAERLLQKYSSELLGRNLWEVYPQLVSTALYHQCYEVVETRTSRHLETRCMSRDRWFQVSLYPSNRGLSIFFQDITTRKAVEQERDQLLRQEQAARAHAEIANQRCTFLANASNVLASSLDYETTLANVVELAIPLLADFCMLHQLTPDGRLQPIMAWHRNQAKQDLLNELSSLYQTSSENRSSLMAQVLRTGEPLMVADFSAVEPLLQDARIATIHRQLMPKSLLIVPLTARGQKFGTMVMAMAESNRQYDPLDLSVASDLARRAAIAIDNAYLYEKAQEANRLKDEFLTTLSHELRTPLNAITGWTNMLQYQRLSQETVVQALEVIEQKSIALTQLVYDVLSLSQVVTGQFRLRLSLVRLDELAQQVIESLDLAATAQGIHLITDLDPSLELLWGDERYLRQILMNLISNSIKFTLPEGQVNIRLVQVDQAIQIVISDTGKGITPYFLPHVFETFRQEDGSTTRHYRGMGIGLSLVRHLVELHGGTVQAFSEGEGKGATFTVELPIMRPPPTSTPISEVQIPLSERSISQTAASAESLLLKDRRILMVDAQLHSKQPLINQLEQDGADLLGVAAATDAIEILEQFDPNLLLIHLVRDSVSNQEMKLLATAKAYAASHGTDLPAIALTPHRSQQGRQRAISLGFQIYLSQNTHPEEIATIIAAIARPVALT